jgi:hypothetical protein
MDDAPIHHTQNEESSFEADYNFIQFAVVLSIINSIAGLLCANFQVCNVIEVSTLIQQSSVWPCTLGVVLKWISCSAQAGSLLMIERVSFYNW